MLFATGENVASRNVQAFFSSNRPHDARSPSDFAGNPNDVMISSRLAPVFVAGLFVSMVRGPLAAQTARPASTSNAAGGPPVTLSAVEVMGDKAVGYRGDNTTSGSRLNTSLRDTPASIQVITPEFMADFGRNALEDIAAYGPSTGLDYLGTRSDPSPVFISAVGLDTGVRARGLEASAAMDVFCAIIPIDSFNTERLEITADEFQPLRYNAAFSGHARVILVEPRQIRGTISLSFGRQ